MRTLIAAMFMATALGAGWAQDAERGKDQPKPQAEKRDGEKRPEGGGDGAGAGFLTLDQVDANGDGKVTRAELEAALKKLAPARRPDAERKVEGGEKRPEPRRVGGEGDRKEGEGKRPAPPAPRKDGEKEGERKPPAPAPDRKEGDK